MTVELAVRMSPAELVNADSRQVIRGLHVATCAPAEPEFRGVPHHLFGVRDPGDAYTVADWAAQARAVASDLLSRGVLPIVVGGTGLYVSALIDGFDFANAPPDPARRAERERQAASPGGLALLAAELLRRDRDAAALVDIENPRRVVRALEILDAHPEGLAVARGRSEGVEALMLGLDVPRDVHVGWIRRRAELMVEAGALQAEVRSALDRGVRAETLAGCGVGYTEGLELLEGRVGETEAIDRIAKRTERYARAQRSYWRRDRRILWLDPRTTNVAELSEELVDRLG